MEEVKRPKKGIMAKEWHVTVPLTKEEFEQLHQLAWRNHTTVWMLGHIAVLKLLISAAKGEFSLVPEFQPEREIPHA